jgi:hypothetical protein
MQNTAYPKIRFVLKKDKKVLEKSGPKTQIKCGILNFNRIKTIAD